MQLFQQQYRIIGSFGASMRNVGDGLQKMAIGLLPTIDTEIDLDDFQTGLDRLESGGGCSERSSCACDPALHRQSPRIRARCGRRRRGRSGRARAPHRPGDPEKAATRAARFIAREIGMRLPVTRRVGLANLAIAFPEKTDAERRAIIVECWENLGRTSVEYLFLDRIWDFDVERMSGTRVRFTPGSIDRFLRLRDDGKPAIIVSAHLANWELPMVAAASHGLDAAALFRAPNNPYVADWVTRRRRVAMGELISARRGAVHVLAGVVRDGRHLGLLSDHTTSAGRSCRSSAGRRG